MSSFFTHSQAQSTQKTLREQVLLVAGLGGLALLATVLPLSAVRIPVLHYLPLHTTLEFVAIVAAFLVFATVWHTPSRQVSASLVLIAVAFYSAGWLDLAHALSYKGMPDLVTPSSIQKAIAFWLAARLMVAVTLFGVSFSPRMAPPSKAMRIGILAAFSAVNLMVMGGVIFYEPSLPATYIEGRGLTGFKVAAEWLVTGLLVLAAWRFYQQARQSTEEFPALIFGAAATAALGEMFFISYAEVNNVQNLMGHLYKMVSYSLIYRAVFVFSIRMPYNRLANKTQLLVQANETLRTQAQALESTTAHVFVTDSEGHFRWENPASCQLLGGRHQKDISHLSLFAAPATPDLKIAAVIRDAVMTSGHWRGFVEAIDREGKSVLLNRTVTTLRSETGELEGFVSVSEDVTETRRVRERHKRVLDTAIDGFWIADVHGNLLEVNAACVRLLGHTAEELRTMNFSEFDPVGRRHYVHRLAIESGHLSHLQYETVFGHKLGHEVSVAVSMTFDPEVQQYFVFVRDITDQVRAMVVQFDLERQLQQAQKMEAMGQLTGGIAHDFNNILVSVLGYSKLALDRLVPDKQSKLATYLREIIMASERARDLIAKMQAYTRKQSNSLPMGVISPAVVVREVLSMMRPSIPSTISFDVVLDDGLGIEMDAGELNQVMINLIINARDALDGAGVIGIRLHTVEVAGDLCAMCQQRLSGAYLALEVSDNGSGIAPEHRSRLFDPFFTTKEVGKGTGLGLSMVQGIFRRAGGHIVVTSKLGWGSQFKLLFPVKSLAPVVPDTSAEAPEWQAGTGQHIGVVDDEPAVTRFLSELLQGQGYRVTQYNNPVTLLFAFENADQKFDLVITDQTMPGLNGIELAERLHRVRPDLPVILCTGNDRDTDANALLRPGIYRHFVKPVAGNDLLGAVAEALGTATTSE